MNGVRKTTIPRRRAIGTRVAPPPSRPIANGCRSRTSRGRRMRSARLATLFRTETRLLARTKQPDVASAVQGGRSDATALKDLPQRRLDGPGGHDDGVSQQESVAERTPCAQSVRQAAAPWQIVGFGTIHRRRRSCRQDAAVVGCPRCDPRAREKLYHSPASRQPRSGLPFNYDNWGGYPAARARFLKGGAGARRAITIVLSGDSHNAWAYDLAQDGQACWGGIRRPCA